MACQAGPAALPKQSPCLALQHALASDREAVYEAIHSAFEYLPLAARVAGAVLVLHGGIGDGTWGIADLAAIARPLRDVGGHLGRACYLLE